MRAETSQRVRALIGSMIFLLLAPGVVAIYVPWTLTRWHFQPPLLGLESLRVVGTLLIAAGCPILLSSFAGFAVEGLGTPAPFAPPRRLVVTGFYRYVRNPMYMAVVSLILGQGFLFGSPRLLRYGIAVWLGFFAFVLLYEEPALRRKFAADYEDFCAHVPRWIPRLRPWNQTRPTRDSAV
jgi:protein-S-isoprenylcysteine O-methyltransferase Ste14